MLWEHPHNGQQLHVRNIDNYHVLHLQVTLQSSISFLSSLLVLLNMVTLKTLVLKIEVQKVLDFSLLLPE